VWGDEETGVDFLRAVGTAEDIRKAGDEVELDRFRV
jgi:hypothetical protein